MPAMTTSEIARLLGGTLRGSGEIVIHGVAKIEEAGAADATFIANPAYARFLDATAAGVVLIKQGARVNGAVIEVADPYASFLRLLELLHPRTHWLKPGIHPTAVVDELAALGDQVTIGALCYIGPRTIIGSRTILFPHVVIGADVQIGEHCELRSNVSVREGSKIGQRVVLQDGVVIGGDGFGFVPDVNGYRKIPHVGIVVIEDDVEIGANTTIDRASVGETRIGSGTKLDNLIQVAHNVTIGQSTVIAAQTGISGSAKIGNRCRIGGQVGIVGHISIGNDVQIGAKAGIAANVEDGQVVSGAPARPHSLWKRIEVLLTQLPDWIKRIRALEAVVYKDPQKSKEQG